MSRSLVFWAVAAILLALGLGVLAIGPQPAVLLALLHAPALLAGMLLLRAIWLGIRGSSSELVWRGRPVLAGFATWLAPLGFLVLWTVLRETGWLDANLSWSQTKNSVMSTATAWSELPADAPPSEGRLVFDVAGGAFGQSFCQNLPEHWFVNSARVTGRISADYQPPAWCWPLWKHERLATVIRCELRFEPQDGPVRVSTIEWQVDAQTTMSGSASRRTFHKHLGQLLGNQVSKTLHDQVAKATKG